MALAVALSRANDGMYAPLVRVEVHVGNGLPSLAIVGLPETAVKESKDRVRAALSNSGFEFPLQKITVNLAPADIPKDGGRFDLPIALGILAASGQLPTEALLGYEFIGELSLGGELRAVKGVLPTAFATHQAERCMVVATDNADEAGLIKELQVIAASTLKQLTEHLTQQTLIPDYRPDLQRASSNYTVDMSDVKGQYQAKRVIEIAATGGHNVLMVGPPGTGKTMLATRLATVLPDMTDAEALETAAIMSISRQGFDASQWAARPVREPHHTASGVALVGGGAKVQPGEISLAHNGVLFLDELTEFSRKTLDVLREPLETGQITLSRAARQCTYPARFQLIAAMNPCPQGYDCDLQQRCQCSLEQQRRYRSRISAPFLDRIDIHIEVPRVPHADLQALEVGESSEQVRERVIKARERQWARQSCLNSQLQARHIETHCVLDKANQQLIAKAMEKLSLSARAYHRILKVARTIADLDTTVEPSSALETRHLTEALSYRSMLLTDSKALSY